MYHTGTAQGREPGDFTSPLGPGAVHAQPGWQPPPCRPPRREEPRLPLACFGTLTFPQFSHLPRGLVIPTSDLEISDGWERTRCAPPSWCVNNGVGLEQGFPRRACGWEQGPPHRELCAVFCAHARSFTETIWFFHRICNRSTDGIVAVDNYLRSARCLMCRISL